MNAKRHFGFTLIELMVVVAVVGILAAIAYPSYVESVRKANRADAKSTMLQVDSLEERYFTENNTYESLLTIGATSNPLPSQSGRHNITVDVVGATYIITATPVNDPTCANLTLTNTGITGNSAGAAAGICW